MMTEKEVKQHFIDVVDIANRFYLNGLLTCLNRKDLTPDIWTDKQRDKINKMFSKEIKNE